MIVDETTPPSVRLSGEGWRLRWALGKAAAEAEAADCTRRRVGAVVLNPDGWHTIGEGYNGLPAGRPGCLTAGACPRGQRTYAELPGLVTPYGSGPGSCEALHAEQNAVGRAREAGHSLRGMVMAVTDEPCTGCRTLAVLAGLALVIWPDGHWEPSADDLSFAHVKRPAARGEETSRG